MEKGVVRCKSETQSKLKSRIGIQSKVGIQIHFSNFLYLYHFCQKIQNFKFSCEKSGILRKRWHIKIDEVCWNAHISWLDGALVANQSWEEAMIMIDEPLKVLGYYIMDRPWKEGYKFSRPPINFLTIDRRITQTLGEIGEFCKILYDLFCIKIC